MTGSQKTFLVSCVGIVTVIVISAMAYTVPTCVKLIQNG